MLPSKNMIFSAYNKLNIYIRRHFMTLAPFLNVKKSFNIILALLEMKLGRKKCLSRPFVYRVDPCSCCNLRCASCNTWQTKTKEKRVMSLSDFKIIIDKIKKYAVRVSLYDMGEPLLNPDIYPMIKYAADAKISTLISTNFNIFKDEDIPKLFASGLTVLEPCLDGFTQEAYAKYRQGGNVETVKHNIKAVMDYKKKHSYKYPIVDVQVVMFDHLKEELPLIDKFLKDCGVDHITYRQENLGFNSPETTVAGKSRAAGRCFWLYLGCMIRPDGSLYPCCGRDFDRFAYGNILKEDLGAIWNNKFYRFSRRLFGRGADFPFNGELKNIPCLSCREFSVCRRMPADR
jgi:radical SAM protein with 4Fe4S-binding SPASM domain